MGDYAPATARTTTVTADHSQADQVGVAARAPATSGYDSAGQARSETLQSSLQLRVALDAARARAIATGAAAR